MKMNFQYNNETGDVNEVTLVLSFEEYSFIVDACNIFHGILSGSWMEPSLDKESREGMIKRMEDMDGDGEDANPIDVEVHEHPSCQACSMARQMGRPGCSIHYANPIDVEVHDV